MRIAFDWGVSSYFGWGVYGLNLALEWSKDPEIEAETVHLISIGQLALDPLRLRAIQPFISRSDRKIGRSHPDAIRLHSLGNEMVGVTSKPAGGIGVVFFEQPLSKAAIERAKRYDIIVTGSTWNEQVLRGYGIEHVKTVFQGVDRSLFHPAPKRGLYPDKFLIFSGGKAEPRKGQDLVVKAFRAFASRHSDAMLVTAWASPWPGLSSGMDLDLRGFEDRVIHVGPTPNSRMAPIYRECDVALFPNRAEGGTNLVAMECIACGVPTILSYNTGHLDIFPRVAETIAFSRHPPAEGCWSEWGESDIEEIVERLETAHRMWRVKGSWLVPNLSPHEFQWSDAAAALASIAREHTRSTHEREDSRKIEA